MDGHAVETNASVRAAEAKSNSPFELFVQKSFSQLLNLTQNIWMKTQAHKNSASKLEWIKTTMILGGKQFNKANTGRPHVFQNENSAFVENASVTESAHLAT